MGTDSTSALRGVFWPAVCSLAYLVSALVALRATQGVDGIAVVWPPSGIFVAGLLHFDKRGRTLAIVGVGIASLVANLLENVAPLVALAYTAANLFEGYFVFRLMGGAASRGQRLSEPRNVLRFAASVLVAGVASTAISALLSNNFTPRFITSWYSTVVLGMLIVTPVIMFLAEDPHGRRRLVSPTGVAIAFFTAALSVLSIGQASAPLLFVPFVAIAFATLVRGLSGTALALATVAIVGALILIFIPTPISVFFAEREQQVLFFQFYLVVLLVSAMPLAILLALRERDLGQIAQAKRLLETAERTANVGHWRYDAVSREMYWSPQAQQIWGLSRAQENGLPEMIRAFHPDDRTRVRRLIVTAARNAIPFSFEARLLHEDGTLVHAEGKSQVEVDETGRLTAIFGTIWDVTDRTLAFRKVETARRIAEREASEVRILAETDPLTGIANRRKLLADIEQEIARQPMAGSTLAMMMVDVDHFKSINDGYGHEIGDHVLEILARLLEGEAGPADRIGRIGGDEFILLLRDGTMDELEQRCHRLREGFSALRWPAGGPEQVTLSAGIAQWQDGWDLAAFLGACDRALYRAKSAGRDTCSR